MKTLRRFLKLEDFKNNSIICDQIKNVEQQLIPLICNKSGLFRMENEGQFFRIYLKTEPLPQTIAFLNVNGLTVTNIFTCEQWNSKYKYELKVFLSTVLWEYPKVEKLEPRDT